MKRFVLLVTLSLALIVASSALAGNYTGTKMVRGDVGMVHGGVIGMAKALGDTVHMLGNPRDPDQLNIQANGTFQDQFGNPTWGGWESKDLTFSDELYWQVSDFNVIAGEYSMWCGTVFRVGEPDEDYGYGDDWNQSLQFTYEVANGNVPTPVTWSCQLRQDSELNWDFTYLEWNQGGIWQNLGTYTGPSRLFSFNQSWVVQPQDYVGSEGNEIRLRYRFASDSNTSDFDGLFNGDGACQVDNIMVTLDGRVTISDDFESGTSPNWIPTQEPGVGDYAALYLNLQDVDPCRTNLSPQVAFVDDGVVVPGTGGSSCVTWCYGPDGWIVNNTGGLQGPDYYITNAIISPPLVWPAAADGGYIEFGVYRHEELGEENTWPGMFYQFHVRSVATGNPADLEDAPWNGTGFVQYGGPDYLNHGEIVTNFLEPGRTHVQLGLRVVEAGYNWGWIGTDGTPAPYFDNAKFLAYPFAGPGISTRLIDIFQDNFPTQGNLNLADLASNSVRIDMANNVAPATDLVNYPGDSIFFDISAIRAGTVLEDMPKMHVRMKANSLFDGVRVLPPGFNQTGNIVEGWVYGDSTFQTNGTVVPDRYNFDLPDEGFFFPGDVFNYYIEAKDTGSGVATTLLPADTTGYGVLAGNLQYPLDFTVRALPSVRNTAGDQPEILFWQDAIDRGGQNEWFFALGQLGYHMGVDYDMYATNGPSSGVGNGLGSRATSALMEGYSTMLYTSASLSVNLLSNGDFDNDPSDDITIVTNWFAQGDKNAFMTGDDLVSGLIDAGPTGSAFVNTFFNVDFVAKSVESLIGEQTAPLVKSIQDNGVIVRVPEWIAYGGCLNVNTFDAVEVNEDADTYRLAEFTDDGGNGGLWDLSAASFHRDTESGADVVMMPYDFMYLYNAPGYEPPAGYAGIPARAIILEDILNTFGETGGSNPIGVTPDAVMSVANYPNPFNPKTTIQLTLPRAGDVSLKVFNVRGELVRTLVSGPMEAGVHSIEWDGKSNQGSQAASGVYFYETRADGEVKVNKMALVK